MTQAYHRHAQQFITRAEYAELPEDRWGNKIVPYSYCEICQCVPDSLVGRAREIAQEQKRAF